MPGTIPSAGLDHAGGRPHAGSQEAHRLRECRAHVPSQEGGLLGGNRVLSGGAFWMPVETLPTTASVKCVPLLKGLSCHT